MGFICETSPRHPSQTGKKKPQQESSQILAGAAVKLICSAASLDAGAGEYRSTHLSLYMCIHAHRQERNDVCLQFESGG